MPYGLSDLEKVFEVVDFLENKQELIIKFKPEVSKFLIKEEFFSGVFKLKYNEMFDELVLGLIRREITNHFSSFTPEEILLLTDLDFIKMVDDGHLFNKNNYMEVSFEPKNSLQ